MAVHINIEAGTYTFTITDPLILIKQVEDEGSEKLLVIRGLTTNPNNDPIRYYIAVTGSARKGPNANPGAKISSDGKRIYDKINAQNGIDDYFVIGDIVLVEAPVSLGITLDGVEIDN